MFILITMLTWQCFQPTVLAQIPNSDSSKKIKTIESYRVNSPSGDKDHVSSEHFDDLGNLVKSFSYNNYPNDYTAETNCTYDAKGNKKCITTDENGKETYRYEAKYAGESLVEEKTTYDSKKFSYDDYGNMILEEEYDSDGNFSKSEKNELAYWEGTTDLKMKTTFFKRGDGDFEKYSEANYIFENGVLKEETVVASFFRYEYYYEYFPNGNLKEKISLMDKTEKVVTKYNEDGQRRVEGIFRIKDTEMKLDQKNKWTYDKHGNEVMVESFRNEKLDSKTIREITYY